MNNIKFKGIYPAIFSVYDKNYNVLNGTINKMVNYQLENGVKGFYVGGNTGECTVLPVKTRIQMLESVIAANNGRGKIFCHVGSIRLEDAIALTKHAESLNVDAISSLPPAISGFYNEAETLEYYKIISKLTTKPVFAYVTPALTSNIKKFVENIMEIDNVIGVKVSISNYFTIQQIKQINNGNINMFNGPDETLVCGLAVGADGGIGTTYNFLPKLICSIYDNFMSGNIAVAMEKQAQLNKIINVAIGNNMAYWKAIMTVMSYDMGHTIEPAKLVTAEELKILEQKLKDNNFFNLI